MYSKEIYLAKYIQHCLALLNLRVNFLPNLLVIFKSLNGAKILKESLIGFIIKLSYDI